MSLRRRRRRALGLPLPHEHGPLHMAQWDTADCPGCGFPVLFLPGQWVNVCGWCYRSVRCGLAE